VARSRTHLRGFEHLVAATIGFSPQQRAGRTGGNSVLAARVACAGAAEPWLPEFVRQVFRANFADDLDIATTDVISLCLERAGVSVNDKIERALAPANQSLLRSQTERAVTMGVFGAPTFIVGQELFWGNDRLEQALAWCESPSLGRSA